MESAAAWIPPAATMVAALMTAANLGARITGWGFAIFALGSIGWTIIGVGSSQLNLAATNFLLTLVNLVGVWRWLGRQARYEAVGVAAEQESAAPEAVSVFAATGLVGRKILAAGTEVGEAVEALIDCRTGTISHVIARFGGIGGIGEKLVALDKHTLTFDVDVIATNMTAQTVKDLPPVQDGNWEALLVESADETVARARQMPPPE